MKKTKMKSRLRMAVLSLLMMCLSAPAWADVWTTYSSSTGEVKFDGSGIVTPDIVIEHKADVLKAKKVTFGTGITAIATHAFDGINGYTFEEVVIPNTLTTIETAAFLSCGSLKKITVSFGANTLRIEQSPIGFWGSTPVAGGITLEFYRPFEVYNKDAGANASQMPLFSNNTFITYVRLYANQYWSKVPDQAFKGCQALTNVELGKNSYGSWVEIGAEAFMGCISLNTITIPNTVTKFGDYAFAQTLIKSVDLNANATVGTGVFSNCAALATVKTNGVTGALPAGWTSISESLFARCSKLTAITLPDNVTSIGASAFLGTGLTTINLANVTSIGDYAFSGSKLSGTYDISNVSDTNLGKYAFRNTNITGVTLYRTMFSIPEGLFEGTKLTTIEIKSNLMGGTIGANAFKNCTELVSVKAPGVRCNATSIGNSAFEGCSKLTTFEPVLTSALTSIGDNAFKGTGITAIQFLDNYISQALTIGESAFEGTKLTSISLPARVSVLGQYAFRYCDDLEKIELLGDSQAGELSIGYQAFQKTNGVAKLYDFVCDRDFTYGYIAGLFNYCSNLGSVTFGNHVTKIERYTFNKANFTEITLPASLLTIGEKAFYQSKLTSITLPGNVTSVGIQAFAECDDVESITFQSGTNSIAIGAHAFTKTSEATQTFTFNCARPFTYEKTKDASYLATVDDSGLFYKNTLLTGVTFGGNITSIPENTFYGCTSLTAVDMENAAALNTIETYAFGSCSSLASVKLPANLPTIGTSAFSGCRALASANMPANLTTIGNYAFYRTALKSITLPGKVTTVGKQAFAECDDVESITFQSGTNSIAIGAHAFTKTSDATKTFTFSCARPFTYEKTEVASYLANADDLGLFSKNKLLTGVTFGSNITSIPEYTFYNCTSLTAVDMENAAALNTIESNAFGSCSSLASVKLPANLTTIGNSAFSGCRALASANMPANLTTIGTYAFYRTALKSISLSSKVTSVGQKAFAECDDVESIAFLSGANEIAIGAHAFTKSSSATKTFAFTYNRPFTYTTTNGTATGDKGLFYNDKNIASVSFSSSNNAISIPAMTFQGCDALTEVKVYTSNNLTSIGNDAFSGCSALTSFEFNKAQNLATIGDNAFYESGLTSVEIPGKVTSIGEKAFYHCKKIESIKFLTGKTTTPLAIGSFAFGEEKTETKKKFTFETDRDFTYAAISDDHSYPDSGKRGLFDGSNATTVTIGPNVVTIPHHTFYYCNNLTVADLQNATSLTTIGDRAFSGDNHLDMVVIPASVTEVGVEAFRYSYGCDVYLLSPTGLEGVTVGEDAFKDVLVHAYDDKPYDLWITTFADKNAVTELIIANNSIANHAYTAEENLFTLFPNVEKVTFGEKVTMIHDYIFYQKNTSTTKIKTLVFEGVEEKPKSVGSYAFYNSRNLTTIEGSVKSVGAYSFRNCEKLTSITITDDEVIDDQAFAGCEALTTVNLPSNLKSINNRAFWVCEALNNVSIPEGVTTIGEVAFANCYALANITLPSTLTEIGKQCFAYSPMTTIELPANLTTIGEQAFVNCSKLASIVLPDKVTTIGNKAFEGCNILTDVTILNNAFVMKDWSEGDNIASRFPKATTIRVYKDCTIAGAYAFAGSQALTNVEFVTEGAGSYVGFTEFGANAFKGCTNLTRIPHVNNFHDFYTETTFGESAFEGCTSLQSLNMSSLQVKSLPANVFAGCTGLQSLVLPECFESMDETAFAGCTNLTNLTINGNAFAGKDWEQDNNIFTRLPNVTDLTFGEKVTKVGKHAFRGKLGESIFAPPITVTQLQRLTFKNNPEIGAYAFYGCKELASVVGTIKNVTTASFAHCENLASITITNDDIINRGAFLGCSSLTSVNLPQNLTSIAPQSFYECSSLKNIEIPSTVTTIEMLAFFSCTSLESIELPSSVKSIGDNAFANCSSLSSVTCHNVTPIEISENCNEFYGIAPNARLYVPAAGLEAYKAAEGWKNFYSIDVIGLVELEDKAPYTNDVDQVVPMVRYSRKFGTNSIDKWQPICVPFAIDVETYKNQFDIAELYAFCQYEDTNGDGTVDTNDDEMLIVNTKKSGKTRPGMPYLIRPKEAKTYVIESENCLLAKADEGRVSFSTALKSFEVVGILKEAVICDADNGYYYMTSKGALTHRTSGWIDIDPNRWYLSVTQKDPYGDTSDIDGPSHAREIGIVTIGEEFDEETAIRLISNDKRSVNLRDAIYTIDGRKVNENEELKSGLYIRNNKKILIK